HRQEPGQHHVRGRRLRGHRPRRAGGAGEVHRRDPGARARHRRVLGLPDHDDADVQGQHQRAGEGGPARSGDRHGGRRAGDPGVRRRGRRRRLRVRRLGRGGQGQGAAPAAPRDGERLMETLISSATKELRIGGENPFVIIGERINPTGRKIFQEQLRAGDLSRIEIDVAQQVAGGAMMLDVNMGAPLADEAELMTRAVQLIQSLTDLPLCLDSSIIEVLEAGLAAYQGKALVNSVTAEDERLDAILPLVKRHGAAVIALPNDEEEIPEEPARRLELARKIVDVATGRYGIPIEDIVFDPLAMPVGADTSLVLTTLETISLLRDEFGVNTTLGASNVSFGMPDRHAIGAAFLPMAVTHGLTSAIMDARSPQLVQAVKAADLLTNRDPWGAAWIAAHRARQAAAAAAQ